MADNDKCLNASLNNIYWLEYDDGGDTEECLNTPFNNG